MRETETKISLNFQNLNIENLMANLYGNPHLKSVELKLQYTIQCVT